MLEKIKPIYPALLLLVLTSISFALGRLSMAKSDNSPINIQYGNEALLIAGNSEETQIITNSTKSPDVRPPAKTSAVTPAIKTDGEVIGSKSGKKYYFPWCGTVKRIKPENQVHFASIAEAKSAGFTPGGNCKGLK